MYTWYFLTFYLVNFIFYSWVWKTYWYTDRHRLAQTSTKKQIYCSYTSVPSNWFKEQVMFQLQVKCVDNIIDKEIEKITPIPTFSQIRNFPFTPEGIRVWKYFIFLFTFELLLIVSVDISTTGGKCHCWWTKESPRAHVAKFYDRLRLIRSILRASLCPWFSKCHSVLDFPNVTLSLIFQCRFVLDIPNVTLSLIFQCHRVKAKSPWAFPALRSHGAGGRPSFWYHATRWRHRPTYCIMHCKDDQCRAPWRHWPNCAGGRPTFGITPYRDVTDRIVQVCDRVLVSRHTMANRFTPCLSSGVFTTMSALWA